LLDDFNNSPDSDMASSAGFLSSINTTTPSIHTRLSERGPRSRVVEALLLLLYSKPMRSSELARIVGKPTKVISSYLSYWRTRGYVDYISGYWRLTERGIRFVEDILLRVQERSVDPSVVRLAHKLLSEPVRATENDSSRQKNAAMRPEIQSFSVKRTDSVVGKQTHQADASKEERVEEKLAKALRCLHRAAEIKNLTEDEVFVLEYMVKHYIEWQSTYMYLDQVAEELNFQPSELLKIVKNLQVKKLLYIYNDRRLGLRIGLGKTVKALLAMCSQASD